MPAATLIASQWQITLGGVALLTFDDCLADELQMSWQASGESASVAGAAFAVQKTFGNAINSITVPLVRIFDTMAQARAALLALVRALPDAVADCVIDNAEGESCILRAARITAASPRIEEGNRIACEFTITGGKLDTGADSSAELGDTAPLDGSAGDTGDL